MLRALALSTGVGMFGLAPYIVNQLPPFGFALAVVLWFVGGSLMILALP